MDYDLLIVGGGPAGLTAAIYGCRANLSVLVLEKLAAGGTIVVSEKVTNYPGFPEGITGAELGELFEKQAKNLGAEIKWATVSKIADQGDVKVISTDKGEYRSKAVIVSSGTSHSSLGVPGEEKFKGRGISTCATCDAPFFKGKKVLVVGGGNAAVQEAIFLTQFAEKVYIVHRRGQLIAEQSLQEKALENDKIEFLWNTIVKEIAGEDLVEQAVLFDNKTGEERSLEVSGVFVYAGVQPNTFFLEDSAVEMDGKGYILTNENMETSVPGIFAAGDVRQRKVRQVITAASDGAVAANKAKSHIKKS